ncbi:hypothetical protein RHMOL_Rhmol10G0178200 [Rhododendron molle]|uniref:Uncharacterized protein n=1 Tax=Rhododendron molle TaxID=49168 RepID=A0ACC0M3R0_RHOML|nr:hypothetical protein RHMOL_Rhmol10G0178200 [Rhododendron molle]
MASGGDGELPYGEKAVKVATAAAMEGASRSAATPGDKRVAGEDLAAVVEAGGGAEAAANASGGVAAVGDVGDSEAVRGGEELLTAAERANGEWREGGGDEVVTAGRVVATPVLRATAVELRGRSSGIGASHPVPFVEGDFWDSARPRDILDALGLNAEITEVLRGARTPEDPTSVLLLGALLRGTRATAADMGSPEMDDMGEEEPKGETAVEEWVTALAEAKAYLAGKRPGMVLPTSAPVRDYHLAPSAYQHGAAYQ